MSLTYVDRIVAPLVEAGCIAIFVSSLASSVPAAVRHPATLALLNVSVHDLYKSRVAEAGGVEAAVALLGSGNPEVTLTCDRCLSRIRKNVVPIFQPYSPTERPHSYCALSRSRDMH